nr:MAG TPA: hypothetical protein [Caudoviricetes sp.]
MLHYKNRQVLLTTQNYSNYSKHNEGDTKMLILQLLNSHTPHTFFAYIKNSYI